MNDVNTEQSNQQDQLSELDTLQGEFVDIESMSSNSEAACSGACQTGSCIPQ